MQKKGFTMIELIIIFTIVFIMTAILISMSYKDRERKELQAVAREVTASIREAQNYSLTGKQTGSGTMPCAFQIALNNGSYQINHATRKLDDQSCSGGFSKFFASGAVELPLNVQMSVGAYDPDRSGGIQTHWKEITNIDFDVPYGKITIGNDSKNTGAEIVLDKNDKYYHICLHTTGLIEDKGINDSDDYICESSF
jgi:type II secretory pathway pseudopilin PulG